MAADRRSFDDPPPGTILAADDRERNAEAKRLRALGSYRVLDSASTQTLDDLTRLSASICGTPIALISLVDESRQWFLTRVGLAVPETPRDVAFCAHAIRGSTVFVVPDATEDPRFRDNPLVTGEPNIRFYAGAPLQTPEGDRLGTLCVIDRVPGTLGTREQQALETLGRAVMAQLELRRALQDLEALRELVPMCAWCRSVRDDEGRWIALHEYVERSSAVTHGVCPACEDSLAGQR